MRIAFLSIRGSLPGVPHRVESFCVAVPPQRGIRPANHPEANHPMAGDDDRCGIGCTRASNRPRCSRLAQRPRDFAVRARLAVRNGPQSLPHAPLKGSRNHVGRQIEIGLRAGEGAERYRAPIGRVRHAPHAESRRADIPCEVPPQAARHHLRAIPRRCRDRWPRRERVPGNNRRRYRKLSSRARRAGRRPASCQGERRIVRKSGSMIRILPRTMRSSHRSPFANQILSAPRESRPRTAAVRCPSLCGMSAADDAHLLLWPP